MEGAPIIGGNWATTEPRYRKPVFKPSKGKLYKLTDVEIDTLDALLISSRASRAVDAFEILGTIYTDESTIRKCLERLEKFGCVTASVERKHPGYSYGEYVVRYRVSRKGMEAFNESMDALEARMMESNRNGIRRNRKRS